MTLSRPPRTTAVIPPASCRTFPLEIDQLLVLAVAVLLLQSGASVMLVLALLYISI